MTLLLQITIQVDNQIGTRSKQSFFPVFFTVNYKRKKQTKVLIINSFYIQSYENCFIH